ncbi:MAG: ATP phosphoribosyltransferase [Microscillaceae bacterium]|nr:ATP phosphoribosyltransferase [Microscillaceae bacterium]MDW8461573.1 ATP phosphoribosyltransferase [Cytophagales bacterium]
MLRLAIQKSGRLNEDSLKLIKECGISFTQSDGKLKSEACNFPIELLYLRDDDIPQYVADGTADAGIVGENVLVEKDKPVFIADRLGFAKCRLSLAVPKEFEYKGLHNLQNLKIATSYPKILGDYLAKNGIKAQIHQISGSVEIAPSIGLANAICDIVSSGSTLLSNGLKEVETVFHSEAVLIRNPSLAENKLHILEQLLFRIGAVKKAQNYKYILMNVPNEAIERVSRILPVLKSPTIMPLALEGWSSLHTVIKEDEFWEIIEELRRAGAEGILVLAIEKMIV